MARRGENQLDFKVGQSGWVSVYWGGRFPTTLPGEVWERILKPENADKIHAYIKEQRAAGELVEKVSVKPSAKGVTVPSPAEVQDGEQQS